MHTWPQLPRLSPAGTPRTAALAGAAAVMAISPFAAQPVAIAAHGATPGGEPTHSVTTIQPRPAEPGTTLAADTSRRRSAVRVSRGRTRPVPVAHQRTRRLAASTDARLSPRRYARATVGAAQYRCLDALWTRESGWRTKAENPSSRAYGIPQALPGTKMATAGPDWRTNPRTQIRWGLSYINRTYGFPCAAWAHSQRLGWY